MRKMRKLIAVALASSVFGGTIGALATAAVQSQASPQAIAAAVQKIQDQAAERSLKSISSKLGGMKDGLGALHSDLQTMSTAVGTITPAIALVSHYAGAADNAIHLQLEQICRNTAPSTYSFCPSYFLIIP